MLVYRFAINCINAVPKTGNQGRCRRWRCLCVHACVRAEAWVSAEGKRWRLQNSYGGELLAAGR